MRRSNWVGEIRTVLMSPVAIAGVLVAAFVGSDAVAAEEQREHRSSSAHLAGHHVVPLELSTASALASGISENGLSAMVAAQASAAGVPVSLVERVIRRESGGNPRVVHAGNYGLMQIKLSTARAMGYTGAADGLLDPQTNLTYAVRYLAGAYRASGGNERRAVALYASGYYAQAKTRGFSPYAAAAR